MPKGKGGVKVSVIEKLKGWFTGEQTKPNTGEHPLFDQPEPRSYATKYVGDDMRNPRDPFSGLKSDSRLRQIKKAMDYGIFSPTELNRIAMVISEEQPYMSLTFFEMGLIGLEQARTFGFTDCNRDPEQAYAYLDAGILTKDEVKPYITRCCVF